MNPMVVFPDPLLVSLSVLRSGIGAVYTPPVRFGTIDPDRRPADLQGLPYVRVAMDGGQSRYPVLETANLRITVWAATEDETLRLAQLLRAVVMAYPGDQDLRSFGQPSVPLPAPDPDSGSPLAFFTVAARLRPTQL